MNPWRFRVESGKMRFKMTRASHRRQIGMGKNPGEILRILGFKAFVFECTGMKVWFKKGQNMSCTWVTYGLHLGGTLDPSEGLW